MARRSHGERADKNNEKGKRESPFHRNHLLLTRKAQRFPFVRLDYTNSRWRARALARSLVEDGSTAGDFRLSHHSRQCGLPGARRVHLQSCVTAHDSLGRPPGLLSLRKKSAI